MLKQAELVMEIPKKSMCTNTSHILCILDQAKYMNGNKHNFTSIGPIVEITDQLPKMVYLQYKYMKDEDNL